MRAWICPGAGCPDQLPDYRFDLQGAALFYAQLNANPGDTCPLCGATLELVAVEKTGTAWFGDLHNRDSAPVAIPLGIPSELTERGTGELQQLLGAALTYCHTVPTMLGIRPICNALMHSSYSLAGEALKLLPEDLRGKFALMGATSMQASSTPPFPAGFPDLQTRGVIRVMPGKYGFLDWIVEQDIRDSLCFLDEFMPKGPDDTWPNGLSLSLEEAKLVSDATKAAQQARLGEHPGVVIIETTAVGFRVHRLDSVGQFGLAAISESGHLKVSELVYSHPNSIIDDVLAEFEGLINSNGLRESVLERFLVRNAALFFGTRDTRSQLSLSREVQLIGGAHIELRPDLFVRSVDSGLWDIVELKRADVQITAGVNRHRHLAAAVTRGVSQLRSYSDFFADERRRNEFLDLHGLEIFEPRLTLVIGRDASFKTTQEKRLLSRDLQARGAPVSLVTYDDLLRIAGSRNLFQTIGQ